MPVRVLAGILGRVGKLGDFLEPLSLRIELGQPALVDLERLPNLGVEREHSLAARGHPSRTVSPEIQVGPSPGIGAVGRAKPLLVDEVGQVDACLGLEPAAAGQLRGRPRDVEIAERIVGTIRVAPEPVDLPLKDRVHDAVLAEDLTVQQRLANRHFVAGQHAVAIDSLAGHSIQPASDIVPVDHHLGRAPFGDRRSAAPR